MNVEEEIREQDEQQDDEFEGDLLDDLMSIVKNDDETGTKSTSEYKNNSSQQQAAGQSGGGGGDSKDAYDEDDDDELDELDNEEDEDLIDEMLENPIDILDNKNDQVNFYSYDKIQIKNIYWRGCQDTILPEGWVQVTHACGMPLYLNRQTRVCTLSRPYYIAQSSARKHEIPTSAIPCLAYQKRKAIVEKEIREHNMAKMANKCPRNDHLNASSEQTTNPNEVKLNNKKVVVSIATNEEKQKENVLTPEQVHDYCKRLFEFDVIKVKKFKTWSDRKRFLKKSKQRKFPENAKLLKIQTKTQKGINKELNINMTNKTPLSILYEYSNQVFKVNPRFEIQEKDNPKDPFQAICYINDKISGKGNGNSKKAAKNSAAEAALCVLIPEFKGQVDTSKKNNDEMYSFFDSYNVEHTHVYSLSQKLGAPLPYDILLTCLKYNFAINMARNRKQFIEEEIKPIKYRNCLYRMKLAQYDVEVNCTKKKEGRQLAAQKILKLMHPHIQTWGSILRLYGSRMDESFAKGENDSKTGGDSGEVKSSEVQPSAGCKQTSAGTTAAPTGAQKNAAVNQKAKPNKELLEKLKEEMRKLRKTQVAQKIPSDECEQQTIEINQKDTLLTIPPLILNNCDFKLSSNSYLVTKESKFEKEEESELIKMQQESEGIIVFSEKCMKTDNQEEEKVKRKRAASNDDDDDDNSNESDSSADDSDSNSDEDDDDDDEDDEDDDEEEDEDGEINDDEDDEAD